MSFKKKNICLSYDNCIIIQGMRFICRMEEQPGVVQMKRIASHISVEKEMSSTIYFS